LRFLWHGALAYLQARRADGIIHASVFRENKRTLWSMSVWISGDAMQAYRNSGRHLRAMRASQALAERIDFLHWQGEGIPTWETAIRRLTEEVDPLTCGLAAEHCGKPAEGVSKPNTENAKVFDA